MMRIFHSETMRRALPFLLWLIFCGCAALWLFTRPLELSFSVRADRNCQLRLFYSAGKKYEEKCFLRETVTPFKQKYEFLLPWRTRRIRLEPGKQPGNSVSIRNFTLKRNGIFQNRAENPDGSILKPGRDIVPDGAAFKTTGTQPELEVAAEFIQAGKLNLRQTSLFLLLFLLGSAVLFSLAWEDWKHLGEWAVRMTEGMKRCCRGNRSFLIYAFCCLMILFGYELFNQPVSEDDDWYLLSRYEQLENSMPGAYSTLTYNSLAENYICHGRWTSAACLKIFTGYCPVLSMIWCLLCMSALFLLLAEKLSLPPAARYLFYPLFIAHPVFCQYHSFFMTYNIYGLSCLVMFLAAVYHSRCRDWRIMALLIFSAFFFTSFLQSLILLFPLWFLLDKMSDSLENRIDYRKSFIELLKLCGVCLLILLGYFLALKYVLWIYEAKWEYLGDFLQKPDSAKAVIRFGRDLLKKMLTVCSGEFEFVIHGQLLLILLMVAALLFRLIRKKRNKLDILLMAAALAGCLLLPFALDIAVFNTAVPVRSMAAFPVMMTGLCMLGWRALEDCPKIRIAAGLLTVFVAVQYGILVNQKAYASKLRYEQDRSVLQSIKDRCYQIPEFTAALNEKKKVPLAVVGNLILPKNRTFPMWNDSMLNCSFEPAAVINLHLLGETYFYPASTGEMKRILPTAMKMPSWPAAGSVCYENGIMIVKLSEFNAAQCRQHGFPFRPVSRDNSVQAGEKLPAGARPVWSLHAGTLDSADSCTVGFSCGKMTLKPSGWHSLRSKDVNVADPKKMYYLQLKLGNCKKSGYLYLGFSDPERYGDAVMTEIPVSRSNDGCILRIPGRYLIGPISVLAGDLPGKEQVFEKFVLFGAGAGEAVTP